MNYKEEFVDRTGWSNESMAVFCLALQTDPRRCDVYIHLKDSEKWVELVEEEVNTIENTLTGTDGVFRLTHMQLFILSELGFVNTMCCGPADDFLKEVFNVKGFDYEEVRQYLIDNY